MNCNDRKHGAAARVCAGLAVVFGLALVQAPLTARAAEGEDAIGATGGAAEPAAAAEAEGGEAEAEEDGPEIGFEADTVSRYHWRGLSWTEGPAEQLTIYGAAHGFTATAWGDVEFQPPGTEPAFDELDLSLGWEGELGGFTVAPTFQWFNYQGIQNAPATGEVTLELSHPLGPLTLGTFHAFDVIEYAGAWFGDVTLGWEYELPAALVLELEGRGALASPKFAESYVGPSELYTLAGVGAGLNWDATDWLYLRAHGEYTSILTGAARDAVDEPDAIVGGLALGGAWQP